MFHCLLLRCIASVRVLASWNRFRERRLSISYSYLRLLGKLSHSVLAIVRHLPALQPSASSLPMNEMNCCKSRKVSKGLEIRDHKWRDRYNEYETKTETWPPRHEISNFVLESETMYRDLTFLQTRPQLHTHSHYNFHPPPRHARHQRLASPSSCHGVQNLVITRKYVNKIEEDTKK